jgi:hypothetical protein
LLDAVVAVSAWLSAALLWFWLVELVAISGGVAAYAGYTAWRRAMRRGPGSPAAPAFAPPSSAR